MKFLLFSLILIGSVFVVSFDDLAYGQSSSKNSIKISFENNLLPSYEIPLVSGQTFTLTQNHSWVQDETSRYNLVSYTLDGETVKISRSARGDFTLTLPTDSSHNIVFSAIPQYALSVSGTNDFSYLPSSPTGDNWFDKDTEVSISVQKITEIEPNKVRQEITGWSLDKAEFWNIDDDGSTSFTSPPILMNEYHQVDFFTSYQYKVNVLSDSGVTHGSGWYEQGIMVPISVDVGSDGLILNSLSGWEGYEVEHAGDISQVFVDGPITVSAKIEKNYSVLIGILVALFVAVGIPAGKKLKQKSALVEEKSVEQIVEKLESEKKYEDGYDEKLSEYLYDQIKLKLNNLHSSGIISDLKYSKIKI